MEMETITRMGVEIQSVSATVLIEKFAHGCESSPEQVLDRVAAGLAVKEHAPEEWIPVFREALDYTILGGRINAAAGLPGANATWVNSFIQPLADSVFEAVDGIPGIMEAARQAAQTMRLGGGVGYDFSVIRPKNSWINSTSTYASGPISYMRIFDAMCKSLIAAGSHRGAQSGVMRCDHPDIFEFIAAKTAVDPSISEDGSSLRTFTLSVALTNKLMEQVIIDGDFELVHSATPSPTQIAAGAVRREDGVWVYRRVRARELYDTIMRITYDRAEQGGVIFLDRIQEENNLRYCEQITASTPCGGDLLPPYGCCEQGHLVLSRFVTRAAWEGAPTFDFEKLERQATVLVRMLDNVLDLMPWPLPEHQAEAHSKRRIGLGFTGLADALIMMGLRYSSNEGRAFAARVAQTICNAAYAASVDLALERGAFPLFDASQFLQGVSDDAEGTFASRLPRELRRMIRTHGIRNSHLLALGTAVAGSLTLGNNCSSGCEPVKALEEVREIRQADGTIKTERLLNAAYLQFLRMGGDADNLPSYFETSKSIDLQAHLDMLITLAPFVDASISKTLKVAVGYPFEEFKRIFMDAWVGGLKGLSACRVSKERASAFTVDNGGSGDAEWPLALLSSELDQDYPDIRVRMQSIEDTVMASYAGLIYIGSCG